MINGYAQDLMQIGHQQGLTTKVPARPGTPAPQQTPQQATVPATIPDPNYQSTMDNRISWQEAPQIANPAAMADQPMTNTTGTGEGGALQQYLRTADISNPDLVGNPTDGLQPQPGTPSLPVGQNRAAALMGLFRQYDNARSQ